MRALISVSDKAGILDFAQGLAALGVEIIATGGTGILLAKANIPITPIEDITGFPEILGGRVKTLSPLVHGGILGIRGDEKHEREMKIQGIKPIDLVVVSLYPFKETVDKGAPFEEVVEQIDIGGPTLIRSAAKNHRDVIIVTDPADYERVLSALRENAVAQTLREDLARKAFEHTAQYDSWVSAYFQRRQGVLFPDRLTPTFTKVKDLRYGENPHQKGAFYRDAWLGGTSIATARQLHGKELSYNNILDANDAFELVKDFSEPTAAVIKHTNPCGVVSAKTIDIAYHLAHETDPLSAFGSVVALNRPCTLGVAELMKELFVEVVIAPHFEQDALDLLSQKKNIRLLEAGPLKEGAASLDMRKVAGGLLVQTTAFPKPEDLQLTEVTKKKLTPAQVKDLLFAWTVCKHVKSNAVVFAKDKVTVGIGAGQMSRVVAVELASRKAKETAKGAVMASDAFFPFRDGIDAAAKAGIAAVIQPGGSIRDKEVISACDEHGMAMAFTGIRLFKH
ncbi:MAG: bifunctional phosphoribosylaminoimidazolecarboxamide formyltransferase/IMP cyclohydrolase [Nanoarchaeota archaeon]